MSYRTDWMDCQSAIRDVDDLIKDSQFGGYFDQAEATLKKLHEQLVEASRCLRIARENAAVDNATEMRDAALARIDDLVKQAAK